MRVALLFGSFRGGGVARMMVQTAHELLGRGFAVDLVVGRLKGDVLKDVPKNATVVELDSASRWQMRKAVLTADPRGIGALLRPVLLEKPSNKMRALPSLVRYFKDARPDAVIAATAPYNLIAVWARRLAQLEAQVVVTEHNRLSPETLKGDRWRYKCPPSLLRHGYLQADAIVTVSDGVGDELAAHANIPRDRITTIYNPVASSRLAEKAREQLDHPWFTPGQPPVVLGAGVFKPQKDFPTLVKAFARVREQRLARLMILGQPFPGKYDDYAADLMALPAKLGIADDVSFPGWVDNPFKYMARAGVFVLSSAWEGLANVIIEALACGCPVASTDCPSGPAEILDGGRLGPLVPVGDDEALASAILEVLDAPPERDKLRAEIAPFTAQQSVDRYVKLMFGEGVGQAPE